MMPSSFWLSGLSYQSFHPKIFLLCYNENHFVTCFVYLPLQLFEELIIRSFTLGLSSLKVAIWTSRVSYTSTSLLFSSQIFHSNQFSIVYLFCWNHHWMVIRYFINDFVVHSFALWLSNLKFAVSYQYSLLFSSQS